MNRYVDMTKEALNNALTGLENKENGSEGKDTGNVSVSVLRRRSASIVRIKQTEPASTSVIISMEFIKSLRNTSGNSKVVVYSNCPKHGWGKYIVEKYYKHASGRFVYKLVCKKCNIESKKAGKTKAGKKGNIFTKLFKFMRKE